MAKVGLFNLRYSLAVVMWRQAIVCRWSFDGGEDSSFCCTQ